MKWRNAGHSTPVDVDPGDRAVEVVQTATEDPKESLLSRIAVLESREQSLNAELASLRTDLVELRQRLDSPSADNRHGASDLAGVPGVDDFQVNEPQADAVLESLPSTSSNHAPPPTASGKHSQVNRK